LGASCVAPTQCVSGICGGGTCLDPAVDTDSDGLLNGVEAALGTDPVVKDSDGDGTDDGDEVGDNVNAGVDSDGDGKIDAIESAVDDCDRDQIPDQDDPEDGVDAKGFCTFMADTTVDEICVPVCDATVALECEGFSRDACLAECREVVPMIIAADCAAQVGDLAQCIVRAPDLMCPGADDQGIPEDPTSCAGLGDALGDCVDGTKQFCVVADADLLERGIPLSVTANDSESVFLVAVAAGVQYELVLTGSLEDGNADLLVFEDMAQRCAYPQVVADNGGDEGSAEAIAARLGKANNPAGSDDVVTFLGPSAGTVEIVVQTPSDSPVRFRVVVDVPQIAD
jgi:hypothetical protein